MPLCCPLPQFSSAEEPQGWGDVPRSLFYTSFISSGIKGTGKGDHQVGQRYCGEPRSLGKGKEEQRESLRPCLCLRHFMATWTSIPLTWGLNPGWWLACLCPNFIPHGNEVKAQPLRPLKGVSQVQSTRAAVELTTFSVGRAHAKGACNRAPCSLPGV